MLDVEVRNIPDLALKVPIYLEKLVSLDRSPLLHGSWLATVAVKVTKKKPAGFR